MTYQNDLIVLVADQCIKLAIEGLLSRNLSLGIRDIKKDIVTHKHHDPGCYLQCVDFLNQFRSLYEYALVIFDFNGIYSSNNAEQIEIDLETKLNSSGWNGKAIVVVIDPEIENWVWSDSPHVAYSLGWNNNNKLWHWLLRNGYIKNIFAKPIQPKEVMLKALKIAQKPYSSSIFKELAKKVSLNRCSDRAFIKLKLFFRQCFKDISN